MKFKGRQERLCVTTLTGAVTDYTVMTYSCYIRDKNNELYYFEAYGLECITGALSSIDSRTIKKLFPKLTDNDIQSLLRGPVVDFLIGMGHPSWHPKQIERSTQGGDIWLYEGSFGRCVGGRHPDVVEETNRSDQYFTVNFVYHAQVKVAEEVPHALEFCPKRVTSYTHKAGFCESYFVGKPVCNPLPSIVEEAKVQESLVNLETVSSLGLATVQDVVDVVSPANLETMSPLDIVTVQDDTESSSDNTEDSSPPTSEHGSSSSDIVPNVV